jgi:hypothetical protein
MIALEFDEVTSSPDAAARALRGLHGAAAIEGAFAEAIQVTSDKEPQIAFAWDPIGRSLAALPSAS